MSETTNPGNTQGSRRSNREVAQAMATLFEAPPEEQPGEPDDVEGLAESEEPEAEAEAEEVVEDEAVDDDADSGEDAEPEDEEPSGEFAWELTVNGQKQTIADEAEARSLAQRGLHYTQEMQALREEQRSFEGERQTITAQLRRKEDEYAQALTALEQTFGTVLGDEPDWSALYSENPEQYAHQRAQWDQLAAIKAEQQRIAAERQQEQQEQMRTRLQKELDELTAKVPEWTDETKRKADIDMIREYAGSIGYSDSEIASIWNHRDFLVLRDAARYRQSAAAGKAEAKKAASKTVEPGKSKGPVNQKTRRYKQQRKRAKKTGKDTDIAPLMAQFIK